MRCYKVYDANHTRYASTSADARAVRQSFVDEFGVKKNSVEIDQIDVPLDKKGLLDFINGLAKLADAKDGE